MSRVLTALAAAGTAEVAQRFGKLSFQFLAPATVDAAIALARIGAVTIAVTKKHPSYSQKKVMEVGKLLNRAEINAYVMSEIETYVSGADTVVEFDLLLIYPERLVNGRTMFGGNIRPIQDEKYVFEFSGFANGVTLTLDAIEVEGKDATTLIDYKYTYCNPAVVTPVNVKGAELLAIPKGLLTSVVLKFPSSAPGGARSISLLPPEIKSIMNDNRQIVYNKAGLISQAELYYILDTKNVETADVLLNAGGNVELLFPVSA